MALAQTMGQAMKVDQAVAQQRLEAAAHAAAAEQYDRSWRERTERLTAACAGKSLTNIAVLGTALLAKATALDADPFALKVGDGSAPSAYSARSLCQHVLAAHAPRLAIDLGVSGREPFNNQPFFGKDRIGEHLLPIVKKNGQPAFMVLLNCLEAASVIATPGEAMAALAGFIAARRPKGARTGLAEGAGGELGPTDLLDLIVAFALENAESGKRAQAVVAGLMDVRFGADRVLVSRVHDPDRRFPGDVAISDSDSRSDAAVSLEVRDKPVQETDLYHAVQKAEHFGVREVGVVAAAANQSHINVDAAREWAWQRGIFLRTWIGWEQFVDEALFWSAAPTGAAVAQAYRCIHSRAMELEVSESGVAMWESAADG